MDENQIEEQPATEPAEVLHKTNDESVVSEAGSSDEKGEFGKFKSAAALLEAYKSLEAEFTRKSQRLCELEKEKSQQATLCKQNVAEKLETFLKEREDATPFADQIRKDCEQMEGNVDFDGLLAKAMIENLASGKSKLDNPLIQKYVFQDEELKNHVIESYMRKLKSSSTPFLLHGDGGQRVAGLTPATPKSLGEAKKMMEEMFS